MTEKREQQKQTAIRLPLTLIDRIDRLAVHMSAPGMTVTRAEVLRLAAFRGVERLEAERKRAKSR